MIFGLMFRLRLVPLSTLLAYAESGLTSYSFFAPWRKPGSAYSIDNGTRNELKRRPSV